MTDEQLKKAQEIKKALELLRKHKDIMSKEGSTTVISFRDNPSGPFNSFMLNYNKIYETLNDHLCKICHTIVLANIKERIEELVREYAKL